MIKLNRVRLQKLGFENNHHNLLGIVWSTSTGLIWIEAIPLDVKHTTYWIVLSINQSGPETGRINLGKFNSYRKLKRLIKNIKED